jgi:hypothetical protein
MLLNSGGAWKARSKLEDGGLLKRRPGFTPPLFAIPKGSSIEVGKEATNSACSAAEVPSVCIGA